MRERDLARPQPSAAADDGRCGSAVVRRAERPAPPFGDRRQRRARANAAWRTRAPRVVVEQRQEPGQALRQHALARARRPDEQQAVPAGGCNFQRAPRGGLAADVGEVGRRAGTAGQFAAGFEREPGAAQERIADRGQRRRGRDTCAARDACLLGVYSRHDEPPSIADRMHRSRKYAAHGTQLAG